MFENKTILKTNKSKVGNCDLKAPFSIAATQKRRGGYYSLDCSALPLIHAFITLSVKQGGIKYLFKSLV